MGKTFPAGGTMFLTPTKIGCAHIFARNAISMAAATTTFIWRQGNACNCNKHIYGQFFSNLSTGPRLHINFILHCEIQFLALLLVVVCNWALCERYSPDDWYHNVLGSPSMQQPQEHISACSKLWCYAGKRQINRDLLTQPLSRWQPK